MRRVTLAMALIWELCEMLVGLPFDLILNLTIGAMVTVTISLVMLAIWPSSEAARTPLESRLFEAGLGVAAQASADDDERAREALQRALVELDTIRRKQSKFYLARLLRSSGLDRSVEKHLLISIAIMFMALGIFWLMGTPLILMLLLGVSIGIGLPIFHLRWLVMKRKAKFSADLPDALELIVRGVRAGQPLIECIRMAANEWRDPLKNELLQIINDLNIGLSIRDAVSRFADRVAVREARLFAIVVAIQSQAGGNISEVLLNLATMLRDKAALQDRLKAMTSEARTSAAIIGSVPFLLIGAVHTLTPDFLTPLFTTPTGNMVLGAAGAWMILGILVMRGMMRIDL